MKKVKILSLLLLLGVCLANQEIMSLAVEPTRNVNYDITNMLVLIFELLIFALPILISLTIVGYKRNKMIRDNHIVEEDYLYRIDNVEQFKKYLPKAKIKEIKKQLYDKFYKIQIAKTKYDYDSLRELCTDELYNMYKTQLQVMDMKAHKHVMDDFRVIDIRIYGVNEVNGLIHIDVYLKVSFLDYVEDVDDKYIAKGHLGNYVTNKYLMTFVRRADNNKEVKCPDCGAIVKSHSTTCEYCRGKIVTSSNDFILSKKTKIATVDEVMSQG